MGASCIRSHNIYLSAQISTMILWVNWNWNLMLSTRQSQLDPTVTGSESN